MKNKDLNLNLKDLPEQLGNVFRKVSGYRVFIFFLLVTGVYGYIIWRINTFSNTPASTSEKSSQTVAQPRIDAATVQKIKSLQDNSVRVQSLFDEARQNPFQE
jgi:hypothetical protein